MPVTPTSASGTVTGTSGAVHASGPSCDSRCGLVTVTSDGWSAVPSRASRKSGSVWRRSQSRARGPMAVISTSAGSAKSCRRAARSSASASRASPWIRSVRREYSLNSRM